MGGIYSKIVKLHVNRISIKFSTILIKSYDKVCAKISFIIIKETDSTLAIFLSSSSTTNASSFKALPGYQTLLTRISVYFEKYYVSISTRTRKQDDLTVQKKTMKF